MSVGLENAIFSALKSLVGNRVSPVVFPQPPAIPTWPAIRYTIISNVPFGDMCGIGGEETWAPRVQIDAVASTFTGAKALARQIVDAMETFDPPATLETQNSDYDADTKTYREILDVTFHGSSDSGNSPP